MSDNKDFCINEYGVLEEYVGTEKCVVIPHGVRRIGQNAFSENNAVESVVINGDVSRISPHVFDGCGALKFIEVCEGVSEIEENAVVNCPSLRIVLLPDSLEYLGEGNFDGCDAVEYNVCDGAKYLGNDSNPFVALISADRSIEKCYPKEGLRLVAAKAFSDCESLRRVELPDGVKSVLNDAFGGCINLSEVAFGKGSIALDSRAFVGVPLDCILFFDKLSDADCRIFWRGTYYETRIEGVVEYVRSNAFIGDDFALRTYEGGWYLGDENNPYLCLVGAADKGAFAFNIHSETMLIYPNAFRDCYNLERIKIPEGVLKIGKEAFRCCYSLKSVDFSQSVREIGENAFNSCHSLSDFELPKGKLVIETGAFCSCVSLRKIDVNDSKVHENAFSDCVRLRSVKIGKETIILGDYAFSGCTFLSDVSVEKENLYGIDEHIFEGCKFVKVKYV